MVGTDSYVVQTRRFDVCPGDIRQPLVSSLFWQFSCFISLMFNNFRKSKEGVIISPVSVWTVDNSTKGRHDYISVSINKNSLRQDVCLLQRITCLSTNMADDTLMTSHENSLLAENMTLNNHHPLTCSLFQGITDPFDFETTKFNCN